MRSARMAAALVVGALCLSGPARAATVIFDGTEATGVAGLRVGPGLFDVTFRYLDGDDYRTDFGFDFDTDPAAEAAAVALRDALNAEGAPELRLLDAASGFVTVDWAYLPWGVRGDDFLSWQINRPGDTSYQTAVPASSPPLDSTRPFADFEQVGIVPVPPTLALLGAALGALGVAARRRRG